VDFFRRIPGGGTAYVNSQAGAPESPAEVQAVVPDQTDAARLITAITAAGEQADPDDTFRATIAADPDAYQVASWTVRIACWYSRDATVYRCPDGTFVAVEENYGATEEQESDPCATAYLVEPYEVTVTKYRRLEESGRG
jgi:hypothetical protein